MSLKIGGADPTKILVSGVRAVKVIMGTGSAAALVWEVTKRTNTIQVNVNGSTGATTWGTDTGDLGLVTKTSDKVAFGVPTTASATVNQNPSGQVTYDGRSDIISAGQTIPAGVTVRPRGSGTVTFTEVF